MILNTKTFWNTNQKTFFDNDDNKGEGFYNNYEDFIKNSYIDTNLKNFKYKDPFLFKPSYGSSVEIYFDLNNNYFGNTYDFKAINKINNIYVNFNLSFTEKNDNQTRDIINYINQRKGFEYFVMQKKERELLDQEESYKSLYSMEPYMIQEFVCSSLDINQGYKGINNINLILQNDCFSQLNSKRMLFSKSLPQRKQDIINEYFHKKVLDIPPSYPLSLSKSYDVFNTEFNNSKPYVGGHSVNPERGLIQAQFINIDDDTLLSILAFVIGSLGRRSFKFQLEDPITENLNLLCKSISHTFVYNGVHSLEMTLEKTVTRKDFI